MRATLKKPPKTKKPPMPNEGEKKPKHGVMQINDQKEEGGKGFSSIIF